MKRKTIGRGRRKFYLFMTHLMAAVAAACTAVILCNSYIRYDGIYGSYDYVVTPQDQKSSFEQSGVFSEILRNNLQELSRMAVIRSQMETDGSFDSHKVVDITAYANRGRAVYDKSLTAGYYLDDLIKWGGSGFEERDITGTWSDLCAYFAKDNERSTDSLELSIPDRVEGTTAVDFPIDNMTDFVPDENALYHMTLLEPRFLSADGMDLKDYASTPQQYQQLKGNLMDAAQSLYLNFGDYSALSERYAASATNVRYCFQMVIGGHVKYFTNVEGLQPSGMDLADITERFRSYGRYLYFNPDKLELDTNTQITAAEMRAALEDYDYVYSEGTRVWAAVDTAYPAADDFREGRDLFREFLPYYWQTVLLALLASAVGLIYLALLSLYEGRVPLPGAAGNGDAGEQAAAEAAGGRRKTEEKQTGNGIETGQSAAPGEDGSEKRTAEAAAGRKHHSRRERKREAAENTGAAENHADPGYALALRREDNLPFEVPVLILFVLAGLAACGIALCLRNSTLLAGTELSYGLTVAITFAGAYLIAALFVENYLSILRRIKCRKVLESMLLVQGLRTLVKGCLELYDNGLLVTKSVLPFLGAALVNVLLGIGSGAGGGWTVLCICLLAVFDGGAAWFLYQEGKARQRIVKGIETIQGGELRHKIETKDLHGENLVLAGAVNKIGDGIRRAVETSMKDERLKADLITNVSHDIKTPLTSIINFVNLLKREEIENEKVRGYVEVLDAKSQRLKQLTDDLVEVSKISSGNITLRFEKLNLAELVNQTVGEFSEKFGEKGLTMVASTPGEPLYIRADGRYMWRVTENLCNNIYKYALPGTRVYLQIEEQSTGDSAKVVCSFKNISAKPLNVRPEELTERFIRGDVSRGTEGSGLGLSIAKSLTEAQFGRFEIILDGDLFKVMMTFAKAE